MPRYGGKTTVESCRSIDVLRWHRLGLLKCRYFSWAWTLDGEQVASINVEIERHFVTLKYKNRSSGSKDWDNVEQLIQIDWSPCRFGGERPWDRLHRVHDAAARRSSIGMMQFLARPDRRFSGR
jgi:hypothetical protein